MGGGGGKGGGGSYKEPIGISTSVQGIFLGALKGFAGITDPRGTDLCLDEFLEAVAIETEKPDLSNIGHPNYRPFMTRRFGEGIGNPSKSNLAYDPITTKYQAFLQLQEGMRVLATASYELLDEYSLVRGDTIAIFDITMGIRRLFLIEAIEETDTGCTLSLLDVLGG